MSDDSGNWNELATLWRAAGAAVAVEDIERQARREQSQMRMLAIAEAVGLAVACLVALWLVLSARYVVLSAICVAMAVVTGIVAYRLRKVPQLPVGEDLLSSLTAATHREDWIVRQLWIGRAVNFLTLFGVVMAIATRLRYFAATPAATFWSLLGALTIVLAILVWNLVLTRQARVRRERLAGYAAQLKKD